MDKILVQSCTCLGETVRYYLLWDHKGNYGVGVDYRGESVQITDLTVSRMKAEALLKQLAEGCVTPMTLRDVVEDWLLA